MMPRCRQFAGFFVLTSLLIAGCSPQTPAPAKTPPAKVASPAKEGQLNTIVLTEKAESHLQPKIAKVVLRPVPLVRSYGGEIIVPSTAIFKVPAPVTGTLELTREAQLPAVGSVVTRGQPLVTLVPYAVTQSERAALLVAKLQIAQAKLDAEGQVKLASIQVDAAEINFERTDRLFREMSGTKKDLDDATAQRLAAKKALEVALLKKAVADSVTLETEADTVKALKIVSPGKGIVQAVYAVKDQTVPANSLLFEIVNTETVWVKVPVYAGELDLIAAKEPAMVTPLGAAADVGGIAARPVSAMPSASPESAAVDLYYEMPNPGAKLRPGQRVHVLLTLTKGDKDKQDDNSLVVPRSAIIHDVHGGTWVYVQTAARTYVRQRVEVQFVQNDSAILRKGPPADTKIVVEGAAELFGAEFGFGN